MKIRFLSRLLVCFAVVFICIVGSANGASAAPDTPVQGDDDSALKSAGSITSNFAYQGLTTAIKWIDLNTDVKVNEKGSWFISQFALVVQIALWMLLPLLMVSLIHAVVKGSLKAAIQSALVYLPVAVIGTLIAIELVQLLLNIIDDFSNVFLNSLTVDFNAFANGIMDGFRDDTNETPVFLTMLMAILMGMASFSLLVVLVLREASIYMATLFLPIMFAMLVWPVSARYFRTLVEFLIAMIFSKLVIVAVLSLVVAGLGGSQGTGSSAEVVSVSADGTQYAATQVGSSDESMHNWSFKTLSFILMMFLASFSPVLLKGVISQVGYSGESDVGTQLQRPMAQPWFTGIDRIRAARARTGTIIRSRH